MISEKKELKRALNNNAYSQKNIYGTQTAENKCRKDPEMETISMSPFFSISSPPRFESNPRPQVFSPLKMSGQKLRATLSRWVVIVDTSCENLSFWRACRQGRKHVSGILNCSCRPLGSLVLRGDPNKGQSSVVIRRICRTEVRSDRASRRSPDRLQHHRSVIVWVPL